MSRFAEFLHDIHVSFWVALVFFVIYILVALDMSYRRNLDSEARIRFYGLFVYEKTPEWSESAGGKFVESARQLFSSSEIGTSARLQAYDIFQHEASTSLRNLFVALNGEQRVALVESNFAVVEVLKEQEWEYQQQVLNAFLWFGGLWPTFVVWQIISIICLFCWWWSESFVMSYFPIRAWWFWVYSIVTLPWSVVVLTAIVRSHLQHKYASAQLLRWNKTHQEYEEQIAHISDNVAETKQQWKELFPPHFKVREIQRFNGFVPELRHKTEKLAHELEQAQEEYFTARAQLDLLNKESEGSNGACFIPQEKKWKEEWDKEFDNIVSNPHIRAVCVVDGRRIELFTDTFQSSSGGVGPFVINIHLLTHGFSANAYDRGIMHNSTGLRSSRQSFCFGNMGEVINNLICEYRINEAVAIMIHSFQTNAIE